MAAPSPHIVVAKQAEGWPEVILRASAGTGEVVAKVLNGELLMVIQDQGEHIKVQWNETVGWAKATNLAPKVQVPAVPQTHSVAHFALGDLVRSLHNIRYGEHTVLAGSVGTVVGLNPELVVNWPAFASLDNAVVHGGQIEKLRAEGSRIVVYENLPVSALQARSSEVLTQLCAGSLVEVVEVAPMPDAGRVRARIANPAGWISICMADGRRDFVINASDENEAAIPHRVNWAFRPISHLKDLTLNGVWLPSGDWHPFGMADSESLEHAFTSHDGAEPEQVCLRFTTILPCDQHDFLVDLRRMRMKAPDNAFFFDLRRTHVGPPYSFSSIDGVLRYTQDCDVGILHRSYIFQLHAEGRVMPRRQEIPPSAFLTQDELRTALLYEEHEEKYEESYRGGDSKLVIVSHPWLSQTHADPQRFHMCQLVEYLTRNMFSPTENQGNFYRDSGRDLAAVFFDFSCLYQVPRSASEECSFRSGLDDMQVLYAHDFAHFLGLQDVPSHAASNIPYEMRGWCRTERTIATTKQRDLPVFVHIYFQPKDADEKDIKDRFTPDSQERALVPDPVPPSQFIKQLQQCHFTSVKTDPPAVSAMYTKLWHARIKHGLGRKQEPSERHIFSWSELPFEFS